MLPRPFYSYQQTCLPRYYHCLFKLFVFARLLDRFLFGVLLIITMATLVDVRWAISKGQQSPAGSSASSRASNGTVSPSHPRTTIRCCRCMKKAMSGSICSWDTQSYQSESSSGSDTISPYSGDNGRSFLNPSNYLGPVIGLSDVSLFRLYLTGWSFSLGKFKGRYHRWYCRAGIRCHQYGSRRISVGLRVKA